MKNTETIALIFGGRSAEHEVSIKSAISIQGGIRECGYRALGVYIDRNGKWSAVADVQDVLSGARHNSQELQLIPGGGASFLRLAQEVYGPIDVVFPIGHGPGTEDGTLQGVLESCAVPYVGPRVLSSAVCMDKEFMKRILNNAKIPVADFRSVYRSEIDTFSAQELICALGLPVFVKPANMGSSVGISRASNEEQLLSALREAFRYDAKAIVEEEVVGRELECSVLGNESPRASKLGELRAPEHFYSYSEKYDNTSKTELIIPADLDSELAAYAQELACKSYRALDCEGMARVDMFLRNDNVLLINEINSLPGFTSISMYPKLWEASGLSFPSLIKELIVLAQAAFDIRKNNELHP